MLDKHRQLLPAFGCALTIIAAAPTAHAQTCSPTPTCSPSPTCSPIGSPVTLSPSKHYFETYTTAPIFLVGLTPEYLCHVSQPLRQDQYCTLDNFRTRFCEMQCSRNNVVRLEAIFNHSPGWMARCNDSSNISRCPGLSADGCCGTVFDHEQPFRYVGGKKWSLNKPQSTGSSVLVADLDPQYLTNLESVVCEAYSKNIVVEVSLFNVWDGRWGTSPFNPANTVPVIGRTQGFTAQGNFMTLSGSGQQDTDARNAQKGAVAAIVNLLKKYPNVIWEIANEPDLVDTSLAPPVSKEQVFGWQQAIVDEIVKNDPAPGNPAKAAHLIEIEGFTSTTFGWLDPRVSIETPHYIQQSTNSGFYGALSLLRSFYPTISSHGVAVGFNENKSVPTPIDPDNPNDPNREIRTAADARAEAWEFALNGGALFDGYSINYGDPEEAKLRAQLKLVSDFLYPQGTVGPRYIDDMRQASCNNSATDWCTGIPDWSTSDTGTCSGNGAAAYWSTLKAESDPYGFNVNDYALYIHHGSIVHANFAAYKAISCGDGVSTGYQLPNFQYRVPRSGCYFEWAEDPETGMMKFGTHRDLQAGNWYPALASSVHYKQDILVFLTLLGTGSCFADPPLTASFTFNCDYLRCSFDASSSTPSSVISGYAWNWADGTSTSTGNPSQLHVFANPGSYNVTLTVSDLTNDSGSTTQPVSVLSQAPTASFIAVCNLLSCTFDASNSHGGSGGIVSWSWSFGDGTGGAGFAPTHPYAVGSNYPVTLTVTDNYNVSSSLTQTISATGPPPVASFLFTCSGLTCSFDASGSTSGNPISYIWTFGDNASGSGAGVNYTYAVKGTYMVTLTVTDNVQRQSTFQKLLTVTNDPVLPGESYFALPPCRVLDTRLAPSTALNNGQVYTFQITGKCGIPSTAKAVSFNVTAVSPTGAGYIDLYPGDQVAVFTTVDFDPARSPRANNTIEQLATNGAGTVGVLASVAGSPGTVHLVLDVDGYFSEDTTPAPGAQGPLGYQTIAPCRILDTRTTNTPLVSGTVRSFSIQGNCGIPVGAVTAALNATIVAPSNFGNLNLYQSSQATSPLVSDLNWIAGTTALANGARPTLAATPSNDLAARFVSVAAGNTAHLLLDTMGYFQSGAPYKFHPIAQCRAAWTAAPGAGAPSLAAATTRSFQIQGNCGVPVGAKAAFISTKILAPNTTGGGLLLLFPSGGAPNGTSFMNFDAGEPAMAGGAIVELSNNNLDVSVASSSNVDLIIKVYGYFQ